MKQNTSVIAVSTNLYDNIFKDLTSKFCYIRNKEDLTYENLNKLQPAYVFFPHWSYIIPSKIYESFNCIIFHMTDLPFGRGGSPLQNLIVRGIYDTKISAIKCSKILDGGDVYLKRDFSLRDKAAKELYKDVGYIIKDMILEIVNNNPECTPQAGQVVEFSRRTSEMSDISKLNNIEKVYDYIRMLDAPGYPYAYLKEKNIKYSFTDVKKQGGKLYASVCIEEIINEE